MKLKTFEQFSYNAKAKTHTTKVKTNKRKAKKEDNLSNAFTDIEQEDWTELEQIKNKKS